MRWTVNWGPQWDLLLWGESWGVPRRNERKFTKCHLTWDIPAQLDGPFTDYSIQAAVSHYSLTSVISWIHKPLISPILFFFSTCHLLSLSPPSLVPSLLSFCLLRYYIYQPLLAYRSPSSDSPIFSFTSLVFDGRFFCLGSLMEAYSAIFEWW